MEPSQRQQGPYFSVVQPAAYDAYTVLGMGPCDKASEIFSRHTDQLCFGDFKGANTSYVNYTPLSVSAAKMQTGAPSHQGWGVPWNASGGGATSQQFFTYRDPNQTAAIMANVPGISSMAGSVCGSPPKVDPTMAPAITRRSYGTYFQNANAGNKPCGMANVAGSCWA